MIECLKGEIIHIEADSITMDVRDVGYLIYCPNPYEFRERIGDKITIFTYQHVREDAIRLYGFLTREEKRLFEKLLQVSGIGPKGALAILASGEPKLVVSAIENEDEKFLVKFPGVGKKTARQIILDLKGKLMEMLPSHQFDEIALTEEKGTLIQGSNDNIELNEAVEALKALGYVDREINKVLPELKKQHRPTDVYIKQALQLMLR
ncbi:MAG: Holliday junction branch migration protein RuvA [Bacillus sp. (in: Bacteria)]|nr:Holliday junction branch migration protein RuvA [Bacillus sp. (in: firmicutes)]